AAWQPFDLGDARQIGLRRRSWAHDLRRGLLVGTAGIAVGLFASWLGGALVPRLRYDWAKTVGQATAGLLGAVIVAVGEEALFRGVLLRRLSADADRACGVVLDTAVSAVEHGLRHGRAGDPTSRAGR